MIGTKVQEVETNIANSQCGWDGQEASVAAYGYKELNSRAQSCEFERPRELSFQTWCLVDFGLRRGNGRTTAKQQASARSSGPSTSWFVMQRLDGPDIPSVEVAACSGGSRKNIQEGLCQRELDQLHSIISHTKLRYNSFKPFT